MSVWNKVLLGLIAVAALVFFHAATRTVKTFQYWSKLTDQFERKLKDVRKDIVQLRTADHEHPLDNKTVGVQQLHTDLGRLLTARGRIWTNCQKRNVETGNNGRTKVTVNTDDAGISDKMLIYIFEEGDDNSPGKYLGEYSVSAVSDKDIVLLSTTQPTALQTKNVNDSKTPWVFYEMMPGDEHELFAKLPDDVKKRWFPEEDPKKFFADEYVKDGQDVGGKPFERRLRDYLEFFRVCEIERTLYDDKKNALERDGAYLAAAKDDSEKQQVFAEKEKTQALTERDWELKQRQATAEHYANLQVMLNFNEAAVKAAIEANVEVAQQIAKIQKEAAEQVDRRSRNLARYGAGAN